MIEKGERGLIEAASRGDQVAFGDLVEPLNRELQAYAYRMLGGFQDAEDALQEARLKAWRGLESYEPRATFRAWMYRILTNTCLDMLRTRKRRVLPQDLGPSVEPGTPPTEIRQDVAWLEPYPDALLPRPRGPEGALLLREGVRLALIRAIQLLAPRQRAALILRDVLDWKTSEVAAILEASVPAVNSALQRARASIARSGASTAGSARLDETQAETLACFVRAWETGSFDDFVSMLAEDAVMSMPPWAYWLAGREAVLATLRSPATWEGEPRPGRYRLVPTAMNGQPAALAYVRDRDGCYRAVCLTVLTFDRDGRISELAVFVLPMLFTAWGYPSTLETTDASPADPRASG